MSEQGGMMDKFLGGFGKLMSGFKASMGPIGMLLQFVESIGFLEPILEIFTAFMELLGVGFQPVLMGVMNILISFLPLFESLGLIIGSLFEPLMPIFDELNKIIIPLVDGLKVLMDNIFTPMIPVISNMVGLLVPFISGIPTILSDIPGALEAGFSVVLNWFGNFWGRIIDQVESGFEAAGNAILDFFGW